MEIRKRAILKGISILVSDLIKHSFLCYKSVTMCRNQPFSVEDTVKCRMGKVKWEEEGGESREMEKSHFL